MSATERRRFCGALNDVVFNPGHIALPALILSADPDAALLRKCDEFRRLTREAGTINPDLQWDRHQAVLSRRADLAMTIGGMEPRTEAGRRAQAGIALQLLAERGPAVTMRDIFVERLIARIADNVGEAV